MRKIAYATFAAFAISAPQANAARIISLGGDFDHFLESTVGAPQERVEYEWNLFEAKYQPIYDRFVYRKEASGWEQRQQKKRSAFFARLPFIKDDMKAIFASANKIVAEKEADFRKMFPDLASDIPVYFLPSLFSFNGKVGLLPEFHRSGLLMGVDSIVERKDDVDVLFSHEFFHAYQDDKIEGSTGNTMASPLWFEGFATYISGVLNPDRNDTVLLMDADLAKECGKPEFVKQIANQYLSVLGTDGQTTYEDWFMMSGPTQPTRRGYCLGLNVMRKLAKTHSVMEMVTWAEDRFSNEIETTLKSFSEK